MKYHKSAAFISAVLTFGMIFTGCTKNNAQYWDDTLPSTAETTVSTQVEILTEETTGPISLSMPDDVTKYSPTETTEPQLATGADTEDDLEEELPPVPATTSAALPAAPEEEYTTVSVSLTESEALPTEAETTATEPAYISPEYSTLLSSESSSKDEPYIFEDPINRPYSYTFLNETRKNLYDYLLSAIEKHKTEVSFPKSMNVTSEDYCIVYEMIYNEENAIFYIDTQMKYVTNVRTETITDATIGYTYSAEEISAMNTMVRDQAKNIISKITDNMSQYDIVKLFYDELALNCVYDVDADNSRDIYGCLVRDKAVCSGYAKAFSYLCNKVGIKNLTITGDSENIPHMWNMVNIGGSWYHIDVTAGYVKNAVTPYVRYDYFCVDDSIITKDRVIYDQNYSYPAATATRFNYYYYNNLIADSWESAQELLTEEIIRASKTGEQVIQIRCPDSVVYDSVSYKLFDSSQARALEIIDDAYDGAYRKYNRESITYNQSEVTGVIKIFLVYLD